MGTLPVRILPHAAKISLGLRLGFGALEFIWHWMLARGAGLHTSFNESRHLTAAINHFASTSHYSVSRSTGFSLWIFTMAMQ